MLITIPNGGTGYSTTGTWGGTLGTEQYTNSGPATAVFSFTGLTPGTPYVIGFGYTEYINRVTNTAWSVAGTAGSPAGTIDQQAVAADFAGGTTSQIWMPQSFTPTGTTLTLTIAYPASPSPPGNYVTVAAGYLDLYANVVFPTARDGDWNTGSTWRFGFVPTGSQFAAVSHAVTVTANTTVGDRTNATVLTATALASSLTVTGCTFTIAGNAAFGGGSTYTTYLTVQNSGSTPGVLNLDGTSSPVVTFGEGAKLVFTGTNSAHCAVNGRSGGGPPGRLADAGTTRTLNLAATWTDFSSLGDASHYGIGRVMLHAAPAAATWADCTFDHCGTIGLSASDGAAVLSLARCKFTNGLNAAILVTVSNDVTTGTRLLQDCVFLGTAAAGQFPSLLGITGLTVARCYFDDGIDGLTTTNGTYSGNFIRRQSVAENLFAGDLTGNYWFADGGGGSFALESSLASYTVSGNVFDTSGAGAAGYCVGFTEEDVGDVSGAAITGNVLVPGAIGWQILADSTSTDRTHDQKGRVEKNTIFMLGSTVGDGAVAIARASGVTERAGTLLSFKDNLCWSVGSTGPYLIDNLGNGGDVTTATGAVAVDAVVAGTIGHNAYCVAAAVPAGFWTTAPHDYTGAGATNCTDGTPYHSPMSGATAPGANDVVLGPVADLAAAGTSGPKFVEPTRNFAAWCAHKGYAGAAAGLAAIQNDLTLIADARDWVMGGFVTRQPSLATAASDGTAIGAMPYQALASAAHTSCLLGVGS